MNIEIQDILNLIARERRLAVSEREWQHRLRGHGYGVRNTAEGRVITSLVCGAALCNLPAQFAA